MTELLTPDEVKILDLIADASSLFFALPEHHPTDKVEWAHEVHLLQQRVMARAAIRAYPDQFLPMEHEITPEERRTMVTRTMLGVPINLVETGPCPVCGKERRLWLPAEADARVQYGILKPLCNPCIASKIATGRG